MFSSYYPTSFVHQARTEEGKVQKLLFAIFFAVLILALAVGALWLARPPAMPAAQPVEQTIPDDHIPR
jgi:hypothetical protein